jgi:2-polyprenyl-3-methyl-5-hydroxy-6-metoxy-1,4-benzoquinol methylase
MKLPFLAKVNSTSSSRRVQRLLSDALSLESLHSKEPYEPVKCGDDFYEGMRDYDERWIILKECLLKLQAKSMLDIGCAEGWFLRCAAEELGCFGFGVEAGESRWLRGEISRIHDCVENYAVIKAKLSPERIECLPIVDVVVCLSVVHHIFRTTGVEEARRFVASLRTRGRKGMIFEMGTSKEEWLRDNPHMSGMADNADDHVRDFLKSAGFTRVEVLGESRSIFKDSSRTMFLAQSV